ncbi:hypothetical protein HII31_10381 [Pseudocercospora fuligena]|uniref:Uncharacterized protein n=1 Tax=Pseudocercospora fuligena TaxID=685502 RepID=A0A8H6RD71_9PEZI|nr:hypothetical protein HII31_10381 [Pseudocercospora fuligena]
MHRPASSGPSSPVSRSSTGSLALTPASTIEEMKQVRILALLQTRDLEGHPDILEIRELLRMQDQVVCLQLAWQRRSAKPRSESFLRWVFALPALKAVKANEGLKVTDLRIICARSGVEWRRRSAASNTEPPSVTALKNILGPTEYQSLDQVPWGEPYFLGKGQMSPWSVWQADVGTELQLVLHHDYLVLAEVPAQPVARTLADLREDMMQCVLCGVILTCAEDFQEPCLFHPGLKRYSAVPDDATTECSDGETDVDGSVASSQSDADDEIDDGGSIACDQNEYTYLCCNRRGTEPGCVVEATHLSFFDVNPPRQWRSAWAQPEAQCGSASDSEE